MAKGFDLTSQKWMDMVFKGKNKSYGAYVLREESSNRHLKALIIVTIVGFALIYLPNLVKQVLPEPKEVIEEVAVVDMANLIETKQEVPEENVIKQLEAVPPPPVLKATVQFTAPKVVEDSQVSDDDLLKTQDELTDTKAAISVATVDGSTDANAVDIADLEDHKVIVQEEAPQIYDHVEEPPMFPGGPEELLKWLGRNIEYPVIAAEQGVQGQVVLRFVVTPDGSVDQVKVIKSLDPSCDREAISKVQKMPKWKPGRQNGNAVYVYYTLPVRFQLSSR